MKRVLSLVLVLVLALGSVLPLYAEEAAAEVTAVEMTAGEKLEAYGILEGDGTGLNEDGVLTRAAMAKIYAYLYGKQEIAGSNPYQPTFSDMEEGAWYIPWVFYAEFEGWMVGGGAGTAFRPNDVISAQELNQIMLRVLGYAEGVEYADVNEKAEEIGVAVVAEDIASLTRGEAFIAINQALNTKPMDSEKYLGETLVLTDYEAPAAPEAPVIAVASVKALTTTVVEVKFEKAVDSIAAANFEIAGVTIAAANLDSDMMTATLTVAPLTPETEYAITIKDVMIDAEAQKAYEGTLAVGDVAALYNPTIESNVEVLKADGASQAIITFSLKDSLGNVITAADNVEVAFTTTFGQFAQSRVNLSNGIATVLLNSEFLTTDKVADLRAVVIEAQDTNLIGLKAEASVLFSPNPEEAKDESLGASMTSAEANQADRVIVYFNKDVNVADYVKAKNVLDATKVEIEVRKDAKKAGEGTDLAIRGILPVAGNTKALQILLDVEAGEVNALTDNSDVFVSFTDKTGSVDVARTTTFKLTDARKPAMLSVTNNGLKELVITFSEPLDEATAETKANWAIDGTLLSNATKWGADATIEVGTYNAEKATDARHIVTITLGTGKYFTAGAHSVQAANVLDWAGNDDAFNKMDTQTIDFTIAADTAVPSATVTMMSPEQYLVEYNRTVLETAGDFLADLTIQVYNSTTKTYTTAPMNAFIEVTKVTDSSFLVETKRDWTVEHNTASTKKNHFNYTYQLLIAKDAVTNVANGLKSAKQELALNDSIMTTPDTTSPTIDSIVEVTAGKEYKAVMSEPVKMAVANNEGTTLAQGQTSLPVVTAQFIKSDFTATIDGTVSAGFADKFDREITVKPVGISKLEAGEWILVVRSISDDIGNTAASVTETFTVTADAETSTNDFKVMWAFADNNSNFDEATAEANMGGTVDSVYIKFSRSVKVSGGVANALSTTNYTLNGQPLPIGTQIVANIAGYDDLDTSIDSVTIILPDGTLGALNKPHVINISTTLTASNDDALVNGGEKVLRFQVNALDYSLLAADITARAAVNAAQTAANTAIATPSPANTTAFVTAHNTAKALVDALDGTSVTGSLEMSYVKAQYTDALAAMVTAVAAVNAPAVLAVELTDRDTDGLIDTATVTFTESIDDASIVAGSIGDVTIGGVAVTLADSNTGATANDNVYVFAAADGTETAGSAAADGDFLYTALNAAKITDLAGTDNLTAVISGNIAELDSAAPVLISATLADTNANGNYDAVGDAIAFLFSENVTLASNDLAGLVDLIGSGADGETALVLDVDTIAGNGTETITLTEVGSDSSITAGTAFNIINATTATGTNNDKPVDNAVAPTL